jgi:hypothetical protein
MDKIKQLLQKCGLSPEVSAELCEAIDSHANTLKEQSDKEFQTRLAKAKKVCFEEVEAHKAELSRRLQIFLEAKNSTIEELVTRQSANKETEAVAKLEKIYALLEGIELNGQSNSELRAEIEKFRKLAEHLVEERNKAVSKAKRCVAISERVLKRNRVVERALSESKVTPANRTTRIDASRSDGQRRTTQHTLKESVGTAGQPALKRVVPVGTMNPPRSPDDIAAGMDETV